MGQKEILEKLKSKFASVPQDEEDIVFILSRVRKILDQDGHGLESKYGILRFYSNLALHTHIDKVPEALGKELKSVHDNQSPYHPLYGYNDLHSQLQAFMKEYQLPDFYENSGFIGDKFTALLNSVYSDTPITVHAVKKYQVLVNLDGTITGYYVDQ